MVLGVIPDILQFIRSSDFAGILAFLQTSGYGLIFIIMLLEGPIVTYVASFAASLGIFNIFYIFILSVLGNFLADLFLFFIGRVSKRRTIDKYESKSLNTTRMSRLKCYLEKNPGKTIVTIKLTPFLPTPGLILAGASNMSLKKFITYSFIISVAYSLFFTLLGFFSGVAFLTIARYAKYIDYLIIGTILLIIGVVYLFKFVYKKVSKKIEKI